MVKEIASQVVETPRPINKKILVDLLPPNVFSRDNLKGSASFIMTESKEASLRYVFDKILCAVTLSSLHEQLDNGGYISPSKIRAIFFALGIPTDDDSIRLHLGNPFADMLDSSNRKTFLNGAIVWEAQSTDKSIIEQLEKTPESVLDTDVVGDLLIDIRDNLKGYLDSGEMTTPQVRNKLRSLGFSPVITTDEKQLLSVALNSELTPAQILALCDCAPTQLKSIIPIYEHDFPESKELIVFHKETDSNKLKLQLISNSLKANFVPFIMEHDLPAPDMISNLVGQFKQFLNCNTQEEFNKKYGKELKKAITLLPIDKLLFETEKMVGKNINLDEEKKLSYVFETFNNFISALGLTGSFTQLRPMFILGPNVQPKAFMKRRLRIHEYDIHSQMPYREANAIIFDSNQTNVIRNIDDLRKSLSKSNDRGEAIEILKKKLNDLGRTIVFNLPEGPNSLGIIKKLETKSGTEITLQTKVSTDSKILKIKFIYDRQGQFIKVNFFNYEKAWDKKSSAGVFEDEPKLYFLQDPQSEIGSIIKGIESSKTVDATEQKILKRIEEKIEKLSHSILKDHPSTSNLISILSFVTKTLKQRHINRNTFSKIVDQRYSYTFANTIKNSFHVPFTIDDTDILPFKLSIDSNSDSTDIAFEGRCHAGNDSACYPVRDFEIIIKDDLIKIKNRVDIQLVLPETDLSSDLLYSPNKPWSMITPNEALPPLIFRPMHFLQFFDNLINRLEIDNSKVNGARNSTLTTALSFTISPEMEAALAGISGKILSMQGAPPGEPLPSHSNDGQVSKALHDDTTYLGWANNQIQQQIEPTNYVYHRPNLQLIYMNLIFDFEKGLSINLE